MTKILVTGGAGYIGSHVCKRLASQGFEPIVFDSLENGHESFVKWGPLVQGDIRRKDDVEQAFATHRPEAVMHLAAYAYVGESSEQPEKYYENNVEGTLNVLASVLEHNIKAFVFSSSCAVYGIPETLPITEETEKNPINPYGSTKLAVENVLEDYAETHDLRYVSLRYFNAAGADQDEEIGEWHDPETHLIPLTLDVALGRRDSLEIYGDDYPTEDGTCVRDYLHVEDISEAHVAALKHLLAGKPSDVFNLGVGQGYSVLEIIKMAQEVTGQEIPYQIKDRRPGDPPILVADASKAARQLSWSPQHSNLEQILRDAYAWQKKL